MIKKPYSKPLALLQKLIVCNPRLKFIAVFALLLLFCFFLPAVAGYNLCTSTFVDYWWFNPAISDYEIYHTEFVKSWNLCHPGAFYDPNCQYDTNCPLPPATGSVQSVIWSDPATGADAVSYVWGEVCASRQSICGVPPYYPYWGSSPSACFPDHIGSFTLVPSNVACFVGPDGINRCAQSASVTQNFYCKLADVQNPPANCTLTCVAPDVLDLAVCVCIPPAPVCNETPVYFYPIVCAGNQLVLELSNIVSTNNCKIEGKWYPDPVNDPTWWVWELVTWVTYPFVPIDNITWFPDYSTTQFRLVCGYVSTCQNIGNFVGEFFYPCVSGCVPSNQSGYDTL